MKILSALLAGSLSFVVVALISYLTVFIYDFKYDWIFLSRYNFARSASFLVSTLFFLVVFFDQLNK